MFPWVVLAPQYILRAASARELRFKSARKVFHPTKGDEQHMSARDFFRLLKTTFQEWNEDKAPRLAAALAYYSAFSIGPLVVLVIGLASLIFGAQAAEGEVIDEIKGTVGASVATALQGMLAHGHESGWGIGATILGLATLLFGASGVFGQLQDALNTVWQVAPKPGRGVLGIIKDRFLSLTMVLGTGFLLLVSLVVTAALSALSNSLTEVLSGTAAVWQVGHQVIAFAVVMLLFAMIFRLLPDVKIAWRDVWMGAAITAVLFSIGKFLLGWYLGREGVTSGFGAAGSLVVVLLWVYYSSLIMLFGAEFTRVYAKEFGSGIRPAENAIPLSEAARDQQGMPKAERLQATGVHLHRG
jgi:membrane protein